jgi:hypothetical protein
MKSRAGEPVLGASAGRRAGEKWMLRRGLEAPRRGVWDQLRARSHSPVGPNRRMNGRFIENSSQLRQDRFQLAREARHLRAYATLSAHDAGTVRMTRHVDPKSLFALPERSDNTPLLAPHRPLSSADGSLVINADGTVSRATPEQQRIATAARASRAAGHKSEG